MGAYMVRSNQVLMCGKIHFLERSIVTKAKSLSDVLLLSGMLAVMQIHSEEVRTTTITTTVAEVIGIINGFVKSCNKKQESLPIGEVLTEVPKSIIFFTSHFQDKFNCCFFPGSSHAGQFPVTVCDIIEHLKRATSDTEACQNSFLFYGPPGTGKTTLVEEIGKLTGAKVFVLDAPTAVSELQGSGAAAVKKIFTRAEKYLGIYEDLDLEEPDDEEGSVEVLRRQFEREKKNKRIAIVFIDEIDAFGKEREKNDNYRDNTNTNLALLTAISKHSEQHRLVIILASNKNEVLDSALLDRVESIGFPLPDQARCRSILEKYLNQKKHSLSDSSINDFARRAYEAKLSPRNIKKMVADAAWQCKKRGLETITDKFVKEAMTKQEHENRVRNEARQKEENERKFTRDLQEKELRNATWLSPLNAPIEAHKILKQNCEMYKNIADPIEKFIKKCTTVNEK